MFEQSEIEPVIGSARFWMLTGRDRARQDELQRRLAWASATLAILEAALVRTWLVGPHPTIADLAVYAYAHLAPDLGMPLPPNVRRWCDRIEALPHFVAGPAPYDASAMA